MNAQQSEQMVPSAPSRQKPGIGSAATAAAPAAAIPVGGWNVLQVCVQQTRRACFHLLGSAIWMWELTQESIMLIRMSCKFRASCTMCWMLQQAVIGTAHNVKLIGS